MRRYSLSAILLLACIVGPLSGCAHTGAGGFAAAKAQKIEAHYDLARLAESEGQTDKAREMYEGIYKKDPSNAQVCHRLGIVNAKQTNYEAAKRFFNEAHRLRPSDPEILNDLGYTCFLSNDLKGAETALDSAIKIDPRNHRATNNLALVIGTQGRLDESFRLFRQVNKESEAHANVAYLYAQQGNGKQALEHYSQALNIDPELRNAANAMVEISRLQQKMEAERGAEQTELANRQPTPAVQQVSEVMPAAPGIPQLNEVIAEARAAERPPVFEAVAESNVRSADGTASIELATPVAGTSVGVPAAPPAKIEFDEPESIDNPFDSLPATAAEPAAQIAEPTAAVTKPAAIMAEPFFEEPEERETEDVTLEDQAIATPVITPSTRAQPLANVTDKITSAVPTVDYVALCPQAGQTVKTLLTSMNSPDLSQMKPALHKLGELAADGTAAIPAIRAALQHPNAYVRIHAALALWRVEHNTSDTLPIFVEGLKSTDAGVRSFAATALTMGPQVDSAVAPLTAAMSDSNAFVRLHAAETLYQYEGHDAEACELIVAHLNDHEANVRWLATFILGEIRPDSPAVIQALTQALNDSDSRIRAGAAFALGGFGAQGTSALPELQKRTRDTTPEVRQAAEEAVRDIELDSTRASSK